MTAKTPKLKIFTGTHFVPSPWLAAMDLPSHHRQCQVVVIAASKADIKALLTERYVAFIADRMAAEMRLTRGRLSTPDQMLTEAGVIDIARRGVYAYRDFVKDRAVIRVETDGSCSVIGHFRLPIRGGQLTVERED